MAKYRAKSIYDDIEKSLNSMYSGKANRKDYKVQRNDDYPDRVTIMSPTGEELPLNLQNYHNSVGSRVWLLGSSTGDQQQVVQPLLQAHYDDTKEDSVSYEYHSSSQQLAKMIYSAFQSKGEYGDVEKEFQKLQSLGNEELGIHALPSVPQGWESSKTKAKNAIAFIATKNTDKPGKLQQATPDERAFIQRDMEAQYENAFDPRFPLKKIKQNITKYDQELGVQDLDFKALSQGQYMFKPQTGVLQPSYGVNARDLDPKTGMWMRVQDPGKELKSDITSGKDAAFPFIRNRDTGRVERVQGGVTNHMQRPNYAKSNVLFPDEGEGRGYERRTWLFANNILPGASIAYESPGQEVAADFWGRESSKKVNIPKLNLNKLRSGEQSFSMNEKAMNRWHGGGVPVSKMGKLTTDGAEEDIEFTFGASNWIAQGETPMLNLPKYVNPVTGDFSAKKKDGHVLTEEYHEELQEKTGFKIGSSKSIKNPYLEVAGVLSSSTSVKGMNKKMTETPIGVEQKLKVSGVETNIARFGGDIKGSGFLYGFFGGMNYKQMQGIVKDYGRNSGNTEQANQALEYMKANYSEAAKQGRDLNVSFDDIAEHIGYEGGGGGQGLMVDIFNNTIRRGFDEKTGKIRRSINKRNFEKYGAGFADAGQEVSYGNVTDTIMQEIRQNWQLANPDDKFEDYFKAEKSQMGMQHLRQKTKLGDLVMSLLTPRRTENIHRSRFSFDFLQGMTKQFPEFATALKGNVETWEARSKMDRARLGIFKYAMFQGDVDRASKGGPAQGDLPSDYEEVRSDKLSEIQAFLQMQPKDASPGDKFHAMRERFFKDEKGVSKDRLLYLPETNQFLPNPRAVDDATYKNLGTESAGIVNPLLRTIESIADVTLDEELRPEEKERRATKANAETFNYAKKMITSGDFVKDLLTRAIPGGISGRARANLMLEPNEVHLPFDRALQIAKERGLRNKDAIRAAKYIMNESEASVVEARNPMPTDRVSAKKMVREKSYAQRHLSKEAYENIKSNPLWVGMAEMPFTWAREHIGDWDADPITGIVGLQRIGNELKAIEDPKVRAAEMTMEKIDALEKGYFPHAGLRKLVNANVGQLEDYAKGKIPALAAMDQKKAYSPGAALKQSFEKLMNKTVGMGVGYNPRRTVAGSMYAVGYSDKEVANTLMTNPMQYQPALDSSLTGAQAAGVPAASIMATAYFQQKKDKDGNATNLLRLSKNANYTRRSREIKDENDQKKFIPDQARASHEVDVDRLFSNRQVLTEFSSFVSETFAEGFDMKGEDVSIDEKQMAAWFALPGEQKKLEKKLKAAGGRDNWTTAINKYHSEIFDQSDLSATATNKILQTPALNAILTNASSKALNRGGKWGSVPGELEAFESFFANTGLSDDTRNQLTTGVALNDFFRRFRDKDLSSWSPKNILHSSRVLDEKAGPEGTAMAKWFKSFARNLDVYGIGGGNNIQKAQKVANNLAKQQKVDPAAQAAAEGDLLDQALEQGWSLDEYEAHLDQVMSGEFPEYFPPEEEAPAPAPAPAKGKTKATPKAKAPAKGKGKAKSPATQAAKQSKAQQKRDPATVAATPMGEVDLNSLMESAESEDFLSYAKRLDEATGFLQVTPEEIAAEEQGKRDRIVKKQGNLRQRVIERDNYRKDKYGQYTTHAGQKTYKPVKTPISTEQANKYTKAEIGSLIRGHGEVLTDTQEKTLKKPELISMLQEAQQTQWDMHTLSTEEAAAYDQAKRGGGDTRHGKADPNDEHTNDVIEQPGDVGDMPFAKAPGKGKAKATSGGGKDGGDKEPPINPPVSPGGDDPDDPNKKKKRPKEHTVGADMFDEKKKAKNNYRSNEPKVTAKQGRILKEITSMMKGYNSDRGFNIEEELVGALGRMGYEVPEKEGNANFSSQVSKLYFQAMEEQGQRVVASEIPSGVFGQARNLGKLNDAAKKGFFDIAKGAPGTASMKGIIKQALESDATPGSAVMRDIPYAFIGNSFGSLGDTLPSNNYGIKNALNLENDPEFKRSVEFMEGLEKTQKLKFGTPEYIEALKAGMHERPILQSHLSRAVTASAGNNEKFVSPDVNKMADRAKGITDAPGGKGLVDALNPIMKDSEEQALRLAKALEKHASAQEKLTDITNKGEKGVKNYEKALQQANFEVSRAEAAIKVETTRGAILANKEKFEAAVTKYKETGYQSKEDREAFNSIMTESSKLRKSHLEAQEEMGELEDQASGGWGSSARRLLGGFGMMYFKSIAGLVSQGQGYGQQERFQYDQVKSQAQYQSMGVKNIVQNQDQVLLNQKALMGSNFNANTSLSQLYNNTPALRDTANILTSGVGTWGALQYVGSNLPEKQGSWLKGNSMKLGIAAAAIGFAADAWGRSNDPSSLGERIARNGNADGQNTAMGALGDVLKLGPADVGGYGINVARALLGSGDNLGKTERGRAAALLANRAYETGMTQEQQRNTEVSFSTGRVSGFWDGDGGVGFERFEGMAGNTFTKTEQFNANFGELLSRKSNMDQAAIAQTVAVQMRNGISIGDKRLDAIAEDYQFGGWAAQTAAGTLGSLGYTTAQMYEKRKGEDMDRLGSLQSFFAEGEYDEEKKAVLAQGNAMLSQLQGTKYIEGVGSESKTSVSDARIEKFLEQLGKIAGTSTGETFAAEQNAANAARKAGMEWEMPDISKFVDKNGLALKMDTGEAIARQSAAAALEGTANARIGTAAGFMQGAFNLGETELGKRGYEFLMGGNRGDQWRRQAALQGDPMMMARLATTGGVDLSALAPLKNIQDRNVDASILANTDISNDGRITGLGWGSTGLQRGSISAGQMATNLGLQGFGKYSNAVVNGVSLQQPITLADGTVVDKVAGQMGLRRQMSQDNYEYTMKQFEFQKEQQGRDYSNQMAMWGVQDRQRDLGYKHQMTQFGFQAQGMQLQARSIEMNDRFFQQNMGLQQRQTTMQRGWTRQDWAQDDQTRALQWGWKQEDFAEERRFMTGRQRRLAERQMGRDTQMKNIDDERIEKGRDRQQELWKLEDERFMMQKNQHAEQVNHQKEQLKLQQKQFEENKKYYLESKKLEDEMIALQRAHYLANHKAAKEQLELSQEFQKEQLKAKMLSEQMDEAFMLFQGTVNTLTQDSLVAFQKALLDIGEILGILVGGTPKSDSSNPTPNAVAGSGVGNDSGFLVNYGYVNPVAPNYPTGSSQTNYTPSGGGINSTKKQDDIFGRAGGGSLLQSMTNVVKTGEKGWEYVINGEVIPHDKSVQLEQAGVFQGASINTAMKELMGGGSSQQSVTPTIIEPASVQSSSAQSDKPIVVVVNIGNEQLDRFITRAVGDQF